MRSLTFSGVALFALMTAQPALADIDPTVGAPPIPAAAPIAPKAMPMPAMPKAVAPAIPAPPAMPAPPPPPIMRAHAAAAPMAAPSAYVRPAYGYQLPQYWMAPAYFIADPRAYGLAPPAAGFGWSRYYDDAVLTDQWGRVYDSRPNYDWHGRGGRSSHDTDAAIAGVGGAAVGAVAGNLIAGTGSRLAGSLIGGGVGALAGLAIEAATAKHRRDHRGYHDRDYGYGDGYYRHDRTYGPHWGGYGYGYGYACNCGGDTVTTTVTRTSWGGGGVMVPRQVVTYENVYAPIVHAPTKMKERHTTKIRPRVRGNY